MMFPWMFLFRRKQEDALSPVIGVMLMIIIAIVIAAVVALFASGLLSMDEEAPEVVIESVVYSNWGE